MKTKTVILTSLLAVFSVFALGSTAPKSQSQAQSSESTMAGTAMTNCMGHGSMKGSRMMGSGMMGQAMVGHHNAIQRLIDQLTADLSAAKTEATSAALKSKLADASSVVAQLQGELPQSGMRTQNMTNHMQNCPAIQAEQHQK